MPLYMYQGNYTAEAIRSLLAKPEDRLAAVTKMVKSVGGKLHGFYMAFGEYDFVAISELPDDESAATMSFAVAAAGHVANGRTTKLMSTADSVKAMARAGGKAIIKAPKGT